MNQQRVILYSLNHAPELTGIGKYNGDMVEWLASQGVGVDVVCAKPYYPEWKVHKEYRGRFYCFEKSDLVTTVRCPLYVPGRPDTVKRLLHLTSFALSSIIPLFIMCCRRPHTIITVQPTLFCTPMVLLLCKLFRIKSVLHIQDFELDAMFGAGLAERGIYGKLRTIATRIETAILRGFDQVSTISHSMMEKARQKGVDADKLIHFPNWSDTGAITPDADHQTLRSQWCVDDRDIVILYAGNLGNKQGLELLIDTAHALRDEPRLQFYIVGDGASRTALVNMAKEKDLGNVHFKPLLPWKDVPAMLTLADVHVVMQKKGVADAVLPSKLTNILAAGGHAVVTAEPETELGKIASKYPGIYTCVTPESLNEFKDGLMKAIALSQTQRVNPVARRYAEHHLSKAAILSRFRKDIGLYARTVPATSSEKG